MLTAAQVAEQLGIKPRTVYDISTDVLPRYQIGGAVRYEQADVTEYKAKCRSIAIRKTVAGALNLTASCRAQGESDIVDVFRRNGIEPRLTPLTVPKRGASTRSRPASKNLSLVSKTR